MTITIPITKGHVVTVDNEDADLAAFKWQATIDKNGAVYATRVLCVNYKRTVLRMHRLILERKLGIELNSEQRCDHQDGNSLNNLRGNLRLATQAQNAQNARVRRDNTSGMRGVGFHKLTGKWTAYIHDNGKQIHLGLFETQDDAITARTAAEVERYGEFSPLVCREESA